MAFMFIFSFIGTILASIIGCLIAIYSRKFNKNILKSLKGFSFGAIICLLILDIIKEAIEGFDDLFNYGYIIVISIIIGCIGLFYLIHYLIDKLFDEDHDECEHHDVHVDENKSLLMSTFLFFISISIHNIPEGISLGSSFLLSSYTGIILSICVYGFHNIIISYSMCSSFIDSNYSKIKSFILTVASSVFAYIFAIVGYFVGDISTLLTSIMLSISAGSLIFVILKELLPSIKKDFGDLTIYSIFIGVIFIVIILLI